MFHFCVSDMAAQARQLSLLGESPGTRWDRVEGLRRAVESLPGVGLFLVDMTTHVLDLQVRLEDVPLSASQASLLSSGCLHGGSGSGVCGSSCHSFFEGQVSLQFAKSWVIGGTTTSAAGRMCLLI